MGTDEFQKLESETVLNSMANNTIISPGGSFIYAQDTISKIRSNTILIYLYDEANNIKNRIPNLLTRGIIGLNKMTFDELFTERHELYINSCDVQFNINHHGFAKTTNQIIEYLKLQA